MVVRTLRGFRDAWAVLQGIVYVYKPFAVPIVTLKKRLAASLAYSANTSIPEIRLPMMKMPIVEPHSKSQALVVVGWRDQPDYSCHPLVVGWPFHTEDIRVEDVDVSNNLFSGVCVLGINDGCDRLEEFRNYGWLHEYRISAQLGRKTEDGLPFSAIIRKCEYDHVTRYRMEKLISIINARYRKLSFELANVDLQSQEAFELARKGPIRQKIIDAPVIYSVDLKHFKPPYFTIVLSCIGETEAFLSNFVQQIGVDLDTLAMCRKIHRIRAGPFTSSESLLIKHFSMRNILLNMRRAHSLIDHYKKNLDPDVIQKIDKKGFEEPHERELMEVLDDDQEAEVLEDCLEIPFDREYTTTQNFLKRYQNDAS